AVKYCNWLTIKEGIPAPLRAYDEAPAPNLDGWHPVVVDDATWISGTMSDPARRFLVEDTLGYRLPMDDESMGVSAYNEWHKAASRKGNDQQGDPVFGALYGCGRDGPLAGVDANYLDSGDTSTDGSTLVGFFNASHTLFQADIDCFPPVEPTATRNTDNGYGLYDASGNVAEWTQDFYAGNASHQATRGGSWRDPADSDLLTTTGRGSLSPEVATDDTGFRVVRGTGHVVTATVTDHLAGVAYRRHFILDLREPFQVEPLIGLTETGTYGQGFSHRAMTYTVKNTSVAEMGWEVSIDRDWVDVWESLSLNDSGMIPGFEELTIELETNELADDLGPGTHSAAVTFRNATTGQAQTRDVVLAIGQPISVTDVDPGGEEFSGVWGGPFDTITPRSYELSSVVDFDLGYAVTVDQSWLTVEPEDPTDQLTGTLVAGGTIGFAVTVNSSADALPVGKYDGHLQFTFVDSANGNLSDTIRESVTLTVQEPVVITQSADPWVVGPDLYPGSLPQQTYTLRNDTDMPIEVFVGVDVEWVDLGDTLVEVFPEAEHGRPVIVSVNNKALRLFDGVYPARLTFQDTVTGILQCRKIILTIVEDLSVGPFDDFVTAGVAGGPISPLFKLYRLTNVGRDLGGPLDWEVSVQPSNVEWLRVNEGSVTGGTLDDGESANVICAIDVAHTTLLAEGVYQAMLEFRTVPDGEAVTRSVSLTLVHPAFPALEVPVIGPSSQPGGPTYSYRMATHHTTNTEFVAFLNDAMSNRDNERGYYMFFDTATGDVYVNSSTIGELGSEPGFREITMFSPSSSGQIEFVDGAYRVVADAIEYWQHPVTGVSWYGAVKYSNWLTIDQGMLPGERCYTEDTDMNLAGWHPVTIGKSDWQMRDLTDSERLDLVTHYRGYRLPMDDGHN
ncbi:MAG: SUMF1/EgtB/PvdO family nonheme iron enzyme, partial [Phycisphaerales bacterium]